MWVWVYFALVWTFPIHYLHREFSNGLAASQIAILCFCSVPHKLKMITSFFFFSTTHRRALCPMENQPLLLHKNIESSPFPCMHRVCHLELGLLSTHPWDSWNIYTSEKPIQRTFLWKIWPETNFKEKWLVCCFTQIGDSLAIAVSYKTNNIHI